MKPNDLSSVTQKTLVSAALYTAAPTPAGQDITGFEGNMIATLSAGAATAGTNPTLDLKLQESDAVGGTYTDVPNGAFTQVTTVASLQKLVIPKTGRKAFIKAVPAHGGTSTPTFPYSCVLEGYPKYA